MNSLKPRYRIETGCRKTRILHRQKYYLRIVSNHNGEVIASSEKYSNRKYVNELASALKDELQFASLHFL